LNLEFWGITMNLIPKRSACLQAQAAVLLFCAITAGTICAQEPADKQQEPIPIASATPHDVAASPAQPTKASSDEGFRIGADDVLAISVWKEPDISRSIPVRSDGKITLALIGELQASGKTPSQLGQEIAGKLQSYISEPEVTVTVQEIRSQRFNVLGQVTKPGSYLLSNSATVLDAIAMAGGFRDFAKKKSIYVLRQSADGRNSRLPFNFPQVAKGKNLEQNVRLMPRDTVIVP
jgi:polysaccharide export outer membrane protein